MTSYGKQCNRCKLYFVSPEPEARTCQWCRRIESGTVVPELYVRLEDGATAGL